MLTTHDPAVLAHAIEQRFGVSAMTASLWLIGAQRRRLPGAEGVYKGAIMFAMMSPYNLGPFGTYSDVSRACEAFPQLLEMAP